jgi:hypothetical protein
MKYHYYWIDRTYDTRSTIKFGTATSEGNCIITVSLFGDVERFYANTTKSDLDRCGSSPPTHQAIQLSRTIRIANDRSPKAIAWRCIWTDELWCQSHPTSSQRHFCPPSRSHPTRRIHLHFTRAPHAPNRRRQDSTRSRHVCWLQGR